MEKGRDRHADNDKGQDRHNVNNRSDKNSESDRNNENVNNKGRERHDENEDDKVRERHNEKEEVEPWESVSASEDEEEESSAGEFDGQDMVMMPQAEVEADEGYIVLEFPRREFNSVLEGIQRIPWTVFPRHLIELINYACKVLSMGVEVHSDLHKLQILYRELIPASFERCLDDKALWRWNNDLQLQIFQAAECLVELVVAKLGQLQLLRFTDSYVMDDLLPLLQTLSLAFDKHCQFHIKHKESSTPAMAIERWKYAKPLAGALVKQKNGEWFCMRRKCQVTEAEDCDCERCKPPNVFCVIAHLMNHFGQSTHGNGYKLAAAVLCSPLKLFPAIIEALLLPLARAVEFMTDEVADILLEPCDIVLKHVANCLDRDVDALSDRTRSDAFGTLSMILKHLQVIISRCLSGEKAENVVSMVQRRMVEKMLGFQSFNKQLCAVREINKLLENARAIASRDNGKSISTAIEWLERKNILRLILRSNLHHKQYVDQIQNIMRLLLLEHRLSEEHLDAIWAATEKPDQIEAVKTNVFDLIADLAWSFSDEQLDSLFRRLKNVQGRSVGDVVKILGFLKKLARSDNRGIMAERLLELLWNMMYTEEALDEVLESGAFIEILGHYISVDRASQDVYILQCLSKVKVGEFVIPSLRLLREIICLDNEKPFYRGQVSRQMRLQQLITDHNLIHLVVNSLVEYISVARVVCSKKTLDSEVSNDHFTHDEDIKERLSFLQFALQSGNALLPWESSEMLWKCLVETPTYSADKESGLQWFSEVLEKHALSVDSLENLLTKKITKVCPVSMSQTAWRSFQLLFVQVNLSKKKLKQVRHEDVVINDLDLVGLPYLWQIALQARNENIVEESINMLRDIHTSLAESLQQELTTIRQNFIDECMEHLMHAMATGSTWTHIKDVKDNCILGGQKPTSDISPTLDMAKEDKASERYVDLQASASINKEEMLSTVLTTGSTEDAMKCTPKMDQVERCLRLLKIFIVKCEDSFARTVPAHGASFKGRPYVVVVSTASGKQSTRFEIMVHSNECLGSLRAKVAKLLECKPSRIRLIYHDRELTQDSLVLWHCDVTGESPICASVNAVDHNIKVMDEQQLPGILISKNTQIYDILFELANTTNIGVREGANGLLALLPTHPVLLADFKGLHQRNKTEAQELLQTQFAANSHLLYTLQILDGIVMPVTHSSDEHTLDFRKCFLKYGGLQYVLTVFEPGKLAPGVDDHTRRGCYSSGLRLLKILLLENKIETRAGADGHLTGFVRAEASHVVKDNVFDSQGEVMITENDNVNVCSDAENSEVEIIDMAQVIRILKWLAWASALGKLSEMEANPVNNLHFKNRPQSTNNKIGGVCKDGLDLDDQYVAVEALELLVALLLRDENPRNSFFVTPDTKTFIVGMLLYPLDEYLRYRAAMLFLKLGAFQSHSGDKKRPLRRNILDALIEAKEEASNHKRSCLHFWELLGQLFYGIEDPEEHNLAQNQLKEELLWLETAPAAVDEEDKLMEGHLILTRVLVEILDCRIIGSSKGPYGQSLVHKLVSTFLFPESTFLWHDEATNGNNRPTGVQFGILGTSGDNERVLQSKCGTRGSRDKAFDLLICLATHCTESLHELVELLIKIHFTDELVDWEQPSSYGQKTVGGYVGLKNGGATCYMNSVFQQLFMQPEVRKTVLGCIECADAEKKNSVLFQIQAMFGALLGSSLDHYTPQGFWGAFRNPDGMPINIREHQDAFEFFNRLYDAIDETLKTYHPEATLAKIFGGIFAQQIICRGCPHKSEKEEAFAAISVDVKNKKNLLESLESFVQGDLLEGEDAYLCEKCNKKFDALKRTCVKSLPNTLVIHLKRFDFDYETMQQLKLKDRFEFPIHLDMKPYTVEGLALRESQSQGIGNSERSAVNEGSQGDLSDLRSDSYYQYDLVGVVVHSGTAFAGHYYSYIKERPGDGLLNGRKAGTGGYVADAKWWMSFDDKQVQPYDLKNLERDCFGGKYTMDVYDNFLKTNAPQEYDKPNSAYMLLYERSRSEVKCMCAPLDSPAGSITSDGDGDALMKEMQQMGPLEKSTYIEMPPSIHYCVWRENLKFVHEMHLLDKDYFQFLLRLVETNIDLIDKRNCTKQLVNGQHGTRAVLMTDAIRDEFTKLNTILATKFLFTVYMHTHQNLRDDLNHWKALLFKMFECSPVASNSYISTMVKQPNWLFEYLMKCPIEEIKQVFVTLLVQALRCAVKFLHDPLYPDFCVSSGFHIDDLIDVLLAFLKDGAMLECNLHKYFEVIMEYARLGPDQRKHLLQKMIFSRLIGFTTKVNLQVAKSDITYLHSIVSLLLRSCDTSGLNNDAEQRMVLPNPLQLPGQTIPLPKDAEEAIFKHRVYTNILIDTCADQEEAIKLLKFCSWQNQAFSVCLLQDIMELVHRSLDNEINDLLHLLMELLLLNDSLQLSRQEITLLGFENFPLGIMDLLTTQDRMSSQKRYTLIKFVVKLVAQSPDTRLLLLGKQVEWMRVVEWLQDQLQTTGVSLPISGSRVSSENPSRSRLQRTNTADHTLLLARKLFNTSES
ncbi:uncharacterized protein LOC131040449 isoform X2 [Cryptomeria japonica]|uniref:uncharacterized protein LOC131040449 isoform X2 n=1 Tax=Cryptomeria japonica TaxID=3369 RepID=UPI0027DA8677|nr:uncharacterized protein LOC131040449 isoform X2 [Cryptomeria japonica]